MGFCLQHILSARLRDQSDDRIARLQRIGHNLIGGQNETVAAARPVAKFERVRERNVLRSVGPVRRCAGRIVWKYEYMT